MMENLTIVKIQKVTSTGRYYIIYKHTSYKGLWKEYSLEITKQEAQDLKNKKADECIRFLKGKLKGGLRI